MAVKVACPNPDCKAEYQVPQDRLGKSAKCHKCGLKFTLEMSADETGVPAGRPSPPAPLPSTGEGRKQPSPPAPLPSTGEGRSAAELPAKIGPYQIKRLLGAGAMGHVYLAHDPHLDRDVALKVLPRELTADEERVSRFLREARLTAKVQHPNTVVIHQVMVEEGLASIVMEYVDGGSLDEIVEKRGPMPWREATQAIRDAAAGLGAAHEMGLVHRDVKPANLMRTCKGTVKVVDFGLVRAMRSTSQLTQMGTILGTPTYMAPEQWTSQEADARSDLYSLVCTYYYLLTGKAPFAADSIPALGYQHRHEPFPDAGKVVSDLPPAACRILARGTEKEPAQRFQTAAELIAALDELLAMKDAEPPVPAAAPLGHNIDYRVQRLLDEQKERAKATAKSQEARRWRDAASEARAEMPGDLEVGMLWRWIVLPGAIISGVMIIIGVLTSGRDVGTSGRGSASKPKTSVAAPPGTAPPRIEQIPPQMVEAGTTLNVMVMIENAEVWKGKLQYRLDGPSGASIDPQSGEFSWTPPPDQAARKYDFTVSAELSDGSHDETKLEVTVTAPVPLTLKPIEAQTVEVGKLVSVAVAMENAHHWQGKVRYSLDAPTPPGMGIGESTGILTWTPTQGEAADRHKVTVFATGPDGRRAETSFFVTVVRPPPPLRLQAIAPQTVQAGKPVTVAVSVENPKAWKGKVRYSLAPDAPPGASIDPQSGEFSWTPPRDQAAGKYCATVSTHGPDGKTAQTTFVINVILPLKEMAVDLGNGITLEMVLIPAGEVMMGSPDSDSDASSGEKPQHRVHITRPFRLGKYPVTQSQWAAVMGSNPSRFKGPKNPVEDVSSEDCHKFLDKLNAKTGTQGWTFVLPSEAEWEYACRAGSTTRYCFGDDESGLGEYAWYDANAGKTRHPVGEKKPNAWGLYDMHGNVCECCQDWYDGGYYAKSPTDDPTGPATGSDRVFRGGCWDGTAGRCRLAFRSSLTPGCRYNDLGLRVSQVPADAVGASLKIEPIAEQIIEAGKPLRIAVTVEDAERWKGMRYSLGPNGPPGAIIDPATGAFTWMPPRNQDARKYPVTVSAKASGGQTADTNFVVVIATHLKEIAFDLGNGVKLEMVLIPAGEFLMGSPDSDKNANYDEKPQHRVRITKPFYLGKYLVTQEQWAAMMGSNPSHFKGPKNPVEMVSWDDCQEFLAKLHAKIGTKSVKFVLPTEAHWEYTCRAGSTTRYCFGDDESALGEYAWYNTNSRNTTHPVGEKKPNAWGLYDSSWPLYAWGGVG